MSEVRPLPTPEALEERPWYGRGLRFECQEDCTRCCEGPGGYVWVTKGEMDAIARHLGIDRATFKREHAVRYGKRWSIRERDSSGDCKFLEKGKGCTIYDVRPWQCRTFPFWDESIASEEAWAETAEDCPGCNRGSLHPHAEIIEKAAVSSGRRTRIERLFLRLREIYAEADEAVKAAGGRCALSGRCCDLPRRDEERHVSSVEVAYLTDDRDWARGELLAASDRGRLGEASCPFFEEGRCSAHEDRPLACRVYSCAEGYLSAAHAEILERFEAELQRLEPMFGIELERGELRAMLARAASLADSASGITGLS